VFWYGRGRSLLAQNLVRWQESTTLPRDHPLLQRTMANDFSTMHCNGGAMQRSFVLRLRQSYDV